MSTTCPTCGRALSATGDDVCPSCLLALAAEDNATRVTDAPVIPGIRDLLEGARIGRYRLLERIGEGGFGTVWMAQQEEPVRRRVALKVLKAGMDSRQIITRFEAERQALALMDHPNIARVFDGGTTDQGRPYFAMELVHGVPITRFCDARKLSTEARLHLFIQVCQAVQHAHQKGVIHRDLKPSNLLVTEVDGRPVPKVVDFGIAKATGEQLTDKTLFTRFNELLGTPAYMSPEQASMGGLDVDSRSDVFSLGVLLYELLTGCMPLDPSQPGAQGLEALLKTIRETEPPKPSTRLGSMSREQLLDLAANREEDPDRLHRRLGGDLDWIILKALEKDRNRRYETADALATDLARHLQGEPVSAAPPTLGYRVRKFARKHRGPVATAVAIVVTLVVAAVTSTALAIRAARHARAESQMRQAADHARLAQKQILYASEMSVALRAADLGQVHRARAILEAQRPGPGEPDLRGWEWGHLVELTRPTEVAILPDQPSFAAAMTYSADGERLAVGYGGEGLVRVWNPVTHELLAEGNAGPGIIDSLAFTPDRAGLYVTLRAPEFVLLDGRTLQLRATLSGHRSRVTGVALDPTGAWLASAAGDLHGQQGDAECFLWDAREHRIVFRMPTGSSASLHPQFSTSGRYLSRGLNQGGNVEVWDVAELRIVSRFKAHPSITYTAAFSPDESLLATCGEDGQVRIWDWRRREEVANLGAHQGPALDVEFSPSGGQVASCGLDGTVRVWNISNVVEQVTFRGHAGRVHRLAYSPDGRLIASAGGPDRTLRMWDASAQGPETRLDVARQSLARAEFSKDSTVFLLVRSGEDGSTLKLWQTRADDGGRELLPLREYHSSQVIAAALCGPGVAHTTAGSSAILIQELATASTKERLESPVPLLGPIAATPDGRFIAARAHQNQLAIWDRTSSPPRPVVLQFGTLPETRPVADRGALVFSPDAASLWIATGAARTVQCLDWRARRIRTQLAGHSRGVTSVALSPDGGRVATGSSDMSIRLWDAQTGEQLAELQAESGGVTSLAFAPDGRTLAAGYFDGPLRLWSVAARTEIAALPAHISIVYAVAFSPDGARLASAGFDGVTRVWRAATRDSGPWHPDPKRTL